MATQYSNKPIVTNGLVYALDFGNQKSYVSGSSSARSLLFNPVTASVSGSSLDSQNFLNLGSNNYVDTNQVYNLGYTQAYTLILTAEPKGNYGGYGTTNIVQGGGDNTQRFWSGFSNNTVGLWFLPDTSVSSVQAYIGRQFPITAGKQHLVLRYSSGSYSLFRNGILVPPNVGGGLGGLAGGGTLSIGSPSGYFAATGSFAQFQVYNRALTSDEIWSNYQLSAIRYGLGPQSSKPYSLDENAFLFLSQSGITDPIITSSINTFVLGLKSASLWDKMIAIYPFVGTGSVGVNLTGSQRWNLKEPTTAFYYTSYNGAWQGSTSGSTPSGSGTYISTGVTPISYHPNFLNNNAHISILSYDTPTSSSFLAGTGIDTETAVSTLAGDYGTPAAAYSVRKVRTAYSGALMDVRRSIDNVTSSIGYVSNGDLDTGSLSTFVNAVGEFSPGNYSGLAAAYSLRRVSGSYTGSAIDVRRIWDNTTGSIGFDASGNLDTGSLLNFTTSGSNVLLNSNDFTTNAKYAVQLTSSAIIGPYGLGSGSFINETSATSYHSFDYNINPVNTSSLHTVSAFVKKQERRYVGLGFAYDGTRGTAVVFDLNTTSSVATGSIGTGYSIVSSSINYVTDGWFRLSITGTTGLPDFYPRFFLATSSVQQVTPGYETTYTGEPGTGSYVYGFQYTTGSTVQPYIETTGTARYNVGNTSSFGYVTRWYDQSGNNRHATQSVSTQQPVIISSGSLITLKGKPSIYFDSVDDAMLTPTLLNRPYAVILVAQQEIGSYIQRIINSPTRNSLIAITRVQETVAAAGDISSGSIGLVNTPYVVSLVNDATSSQVYSNTVNKTTTFNNNDFGLMNFGASGVYNEPAQAFVSEVIAYTGSIQISSSRTFIENNINNYYSIYTGSNDGFVARWYDQSGNNRHANQALTGSQPLIIRSGSLLLDPTSSKPAIVFDGVDDWLRNTTSLIISSATPASIFTVNRPFGIATYPYLFDIGQQDILFYYYPANKHSMYRGGELSSTISATANTSYLYNLLYNDTNSELKVNGNLFTGSVGTLSTGGELTIAAEGGSTPSAGTYYSGSINELVVYASNQGGNRAPIEYNINNYYNIYPQTSSFTTSSFTIKATPTGITGAINNQPLNGISSTGPVGFITVSRTGSNALTIARNGVTSSFTVPASGALSTGIYLGASNYNGITVGSSPLGISFASVGVGLNNSDTITLNGLVSELQGNLNTDADATAFIQAAGLTGSYLDSTKIPSAITFLTQNLKRYGLWTKMRAIYPFVGNNQNSHRINLKSPSLYPLSYGSGYTFSTQNGSVPGATITGFDMGINANAILSPNSGSIGFYTPTNVVRNGWTFGNTQFSLVIALYGVSSVYFNYSDTVATTAYGRGFYAMSKTGSFVEGFYNSTRIYSGSQSTGSISGNLTFGLGQGTTSDAAFTFGYVADSLTTSDVQNLYSIVQSYQTILGRQV